MTQIPGPQTGNKWTKYSIDFKEIFEIDRFLWNWENILFTWSQFADLEAGSSRNFLTSHKLRISGKFLPMGSTLTKSKKLHTAGFSNFLLMWTKMELKKFSWLEWPNCILFKTPCWQKIWFTLPFHFCLELPNDRLAGDFLHVLLWKTSPRVLGSCDKLSSLLELITIS